MAKSRRKSKVAQEPHGIPRYRKAGSCPACGEPMAVLTNPEALQGLGQSTPSVLASCTHVYAGFSIQGVEAAEDEEDDEDEDDITPRKEPDADGPHETLWRRGV